MKSRLTFRRLTFRPPTKVKLGLPKVWLRRVVSVLTARPFKVKIPPPINASADDRRLANKRERFLQAVWTAMERIQRQRLTLRLTDHVAGDGQGWLKLNFKPQVWEVAAVSRGDIQGARCRERTDKAGNQRAQAPHHGVEAQRAGAFQRPGHGPGHHLSRLGRRRTGRFGRNVPHAVGAESRGS